MPWSSALEAVKVLVRAMSKRVDEHAVGALVAMVDGATRSSSVDREGHGGEIEKRGTTAALRESMEGGACRPRKRKPPSKLLDVHM